MEPLVPRSALRPHLPVIGVDVGGTKVAALVVAPDGMVLCRLERPMVSHDPAAGLAHVVDLVREAPAGAGGPGSLAAVGIGVPGRVDAQSRTVELAVNLGWTGVALGDEVSGALGVPCLVENDVRVAAAGLLDTAADGVLSLAYVAVGTGIGAGIVLAGQLYRGVRGMAGEIGHVVVDPAGARCRCGLRGCLETVAAGPAIERRAREALAAGRPSSLAGGPVTTEAVYRAASSGDALAREIVESAGVALARAIHGLVMTCDLERVLIGGGVARAGESFMRPIEAELVRLRRASPLATQMVAEHTVSLLPPDYDAVAWGAVALARRISSGGPGERGDGKREVGTPNQEQAESPADPGVPDRTQPRDH